MDAAPCADVEWWVGFLLCLAWCYHQCQSRRTGCWTIRRMILQNWRPSEGRSCIMTIVREVVLQRGTSKNETISRVIVCCQSLWEFTLCILHMMSLVFQYHWLIYIHWKSKNIPMIMCTHLSLLRCGRSLSPSPWWYIRTWSTTLGSRPCAVHSATVYAELGSPCMQQSSPQGPTLRTLQTNLSL